MRDRALGARLACDLCGSRRGVQVTRLPDGGERRHCHACSATTFAGQEPRVAGDPERARQIRAQRRDHLEQQRREREAYAREPEQYLRARLRREVARVIDDRRAEVGYAVPLTSRDVDRARRRIADSLGIEMHDVPAAHSWPLWPRASSAIAPQSALTMPAVWECHPHDEDPAWIAEFMFALECEFALCGADLAYIDELANPWASIPETLHRARMRARRAMQREAAVKLRAAA